MGTNGRGQVFELHRAIGRGLRYWSGQLTATGDVQWREHRRYDTGRETAVALRDDEIVIDVHRTHTGLQRLWSAVGRLRADYSID